MSNKSNNGVPDWMDSESKRAEELMNSGKQVNNPSASKDPSIKRKKINRSVKGFYVRAEYQITFDQLALEEKHKSNKKAPDLIEEALEDLFKKYNKEIYKL